MSKCLQQEGNKSKHLLNRFNFVSEAIPTKIESDIEILKLHMIQNPVAIQICGMFFLNYVILYAVSIINWRSIGDNLEIIRFILLQIISAGAEYLIMLVQFEMAG